MDRKEIGIGLAHETEITLKKTAFPKYFMQKLSSDLNFALIVKRLYENRLNFLNEKIVPKVGKITFDDKLSCEDFSCVNPILSFLNIDPVDFFGWIARNENFARFLVLSLFIGDRIFQIEVDEKKLYESQSEFEPDFTKEEHKNLFSRYFFPMSERKYSRKIVLISLDDYWSRFKKGHINFLEVCRCMDLFGLIDCTAYELFEIHRSVPAASEAKRIISFGSKLETHADTNFMYFPVFFKDTNNFSHFGTLPVWKKTDDIEIKWGSYFAAALNQINE